VGETVDVDDPRGLPIAGARPERADAAANRERILEAAARVLAERGAEGTSIDAVAAEAGVGKGTVFRRFGDRSGLFQALSDEHLRTFQDAFLLGPPPLGPGAPAEDRLAAFLDGLLDLHEDHLELTLALERDRWGAPIEGYLALSVHVESLIREISPTLDAPVTAQLLLNALNVKLVRYLRRDAGVSMATIKASMRPLLAGIRARLAQGSAVRVSAQRAPPSLISLSTTAATLARCAPRSTSSPAANPRSSRSLRRITRAASRIPSSTTRSRTTVSIRSTWSGSRRTGARSWAGRPRIRRGAATSPPCW
jgi:AcrR family transcriptional regulator